ncbi:MAG TPA: hypothetical protein VL200_02665 [Lacunisphaera sp.]|nr:hypothetical protein [Lacunisphaera sp.]
MAQVSERTNPSRGGERGSMLLAAMLFAAGLALVLGSYLALGRTTLQVAHRSYFANDAANLADAGLEEALYCFNQMAAGSAVGAVWTDWTIAGPNAMKTLPTFNRDQNAIGVVKVYVVGYDGSNPTPTVISQATLTPFDGGAPISKTVRITLKGGGAPVYGLVALHGLTLKNTSSADSFDSNPSKSPTGPWADYSAANATANTTVVVLDGSISIASGRIHGDLKLGATVSTPPSSDYTGSVTTNFSAAFPLPDYPTAGDVDQSYNLGSSLPAGLPRSGDVPAADGRYYYFCRNTTIGAVTISAGANVTIVGTNTGMGAGLVINGTGTCAIYIDKTVVLGTGRTINDTNWAGALHIFSSTTGTCSFASNSRITACLYAPNADISATGTGASGMLTGSFVADTITAANKMNFHFDEALRGAGSGGTWAVTGWLELQSEADRATVAGLTNNFLR